jgi:UDP-arabinose 4-epimerase
MKVLVTGGAGYVGSHVCKLLRGKGLPHLVFDDFSTGHYDMLRGSPFFKGDLADAAAVTACVQNFRPDIVIHLAAIATIPGCNANPERTRAVNVAGTEHFLEAMRQCKVPAMVMASSCAVYAPTPTPRPFTEDDPLAPPTLYGQTKLEGEHLLRRYHDQHGISFAAMRIFNVSGADPEGDIGESHSPETHLLPLAIEAALTGTPLQLYGNDYPTEDGTAVRDYVHVCDIAETAVSCAESLASKPDAFMINTGSGKPSSVLQIIRAVEAHTGRKVPFNASGRRPGDEPYLLGDNSRLKARFPHLPQRSDLQTIVASAYAWHHRNASTSDQG